MLCFMPVATFLFCHLIVFSHASLWEQSMRDYSGTQVHCSLYVFLEDTTELYKYTILNDFLENVLGQHVSKYNNRNLQKDI